MGQRHQAFIIARIVPHGSTDGKAYYRCLGALHHQWCYGSLPLRAANRFFELVKNPVNASIIRGELKSLHGKYGRYGQKPDLNAVPCPYSVFLLTCAFKIDFERSYVSGGPLQHGLLPANMGCWDGDNNDGLTILDITDPVNPSYAFCLGPETDADLGDEPCTAEDYLRAYFPDLGPASEDSADDATMLELVAKFDSLPFLTEEKLAEAWPDEFGSSKSPEGRRPAARKSVPKPLPDNPPSSGTIVPPLTDLVIEAAVARNLEYGTAEEMEHLVPSRTVEIKQVLRTHNPFPDNGLALLVSVLGEELKHTSGTLDLTGFSLSPDQLTSIVSELKNIRIVVLSQSPEVKIDHVRALLVAKPEIDRLELLDTGITEKALFSLLQEHAELFKRVSDIVHPYLCSLRRHLNPGSFHVFASQAESFIRFNESPGLMQAIPAWTPAKIVQNILEFLTILIDDKSQTSDNTQSILIPAALSAGLRKPGTPWKDASLPMLASSFGRLHLGGWLFLFKQKNAMMASMGRGSSESKYAFAKVLEHGVQAYDIKGFLDEMEKEGRGPLPGATIVQEFKNLVNSKGGSKAKKGSSEEDQPQALSDIMRALMGGLNMSDESSPDLEPKTSLFDSKEASKYVTELVRSATQKKNTSATKGPPMTL
ncbi:hypothetical protein GYMLUDRAFT_40180 [Collybiopsis luxurians FD-317 M1]|uniref:Uncharacterized protein n=1 Tax=Collybiopsis luxurians FD-317 M1 TaxID=944289 RepID=A0A0D0C727_9AGAR|nr:hypothetical protein GYMLUDRAFT_40180 [Collybiopsis luxurians FD-317 M1]